MIASMRALVVLLLLLPRAATADDLDPTAIHDLVVEYKRLALESASAGACGPARDLSFKVLGLDPAFHAAEFATDPELAPCLQPAVHDILPSKVAPPRDERPVVPTHPTEPVRGPTPPVRPGRVVAQVFLGGLISLVGAGLGLLAGAVICVDDSCEDSALIGAYIGGAIAFGVGAHGIGSLGEQTGSLPATVIGAAVGAGVGLVGLAAPDSNRELGIGLFVGAPIVGALVGFHLTRRWREPKVAVGSLLYLDRGAISLGVPIVGHADQRTTLSLLAGSF